jgi:hypothetical protein
MNFFSDRENGPRPQTIEELPETAWEGLKAEIAARVESGAFGVNYPATCPDGMGAIGTDASSFWTAMRARIPSLEEQPWFHAADMPSLNDAMDVLEFCWRNVGKPLRRGYHDYFKHYHLDFDVEIGREKFRAVVNEIFRRNGLAYELTADGQVQRLAPAVLREALANTVFQTGDSLLDGMLESARRKFLDSNEAIRREALEKLWDAFERAKTLGIGSDKRDQVKRLLDKAAGSDTSNFRQVLERDARELTDIGNQLQIRHSETTQEPLTCSAHVDYVFHRLFSFLLLLLDTQRPRGG